MSRFQVGQKHPFVRHTVWLRDLKGNRTRTSHSLTPHGEDTESTEIVYLTCISEHDVPHEYDESQLAKGYIFKKDDCEHDFHNQYPTASYGQVSTFGDWVASAFYETESGYEEQEYFSVSEALNSIERFGKNGEALPEYLSKIKSIMLKSLEENGFKLEETDFSKRHSQAIGYKNWKIVPA
ncbi:hypothetical protein B9J93_11855 [Vibrio sp. V17_P4S1T151]|uniref:hypothetical protein n=1 Tax=unclassified Vibrio TaxID=2614977 RepID=UPI000B8E3AB1|nr:MULTISPECIES: hypothetical protein [unclassified Vibrio]OXX45122.1 hypothetical protein B9J93_11855 [Vibrio sp. V17_P4S1T151]OXX65283.1 hypothetical protein B9J89_05155 [Vibrio sp. V15_P4S5T153]